MKEKKTLMRLIAYLTGLLFAVYSAYNVFIIVKDKKLPPEGLLISAVVALMFAVLAVFMWTFEIKPKNKKKETDKKKKRKKKIRRIRFRIIRRAAFLIALLTLIGLKLRMSYQVIDFIDVTKPQTVLYGVAYIFTVVGMLILFVFYAFIRKRYLLFPKAAALLPKIAMVLFLCSLILEAILFLAYGIGAESSTLRNIVIRPVFYLGFIGLSAFFLYPPQSK